MFGLQTHAVVKFTFSDLHCQMHRQAAEDYYIMYVTQITQKNIGNTFNGKLGFYEAIFS